MDPATAGGLVLSVIGLFPLCVDGFMVITQCFTAHKDVQDAMTRIEWQKYVLSPPLSMFMRILCANIYADLDGCVRLHSSGTPYFCFKPLILIPVQSLGRELGNQRRFLQLEASHLS